MSTFLIFLLKYFLMPLGIAAVMYVFVHLQLLLLHKVLDLGLTHAKRTRINILAFFSTFFAVIVLVMIRDCLMPQ